MTDALKPCPFCGGLAKASSASGAESVSQVQCNRCGAATNCFMYRSEAIAAWNRRAPVEITDEMIGRALKAMLHQDQPRDPGFCMRTALAAALNPKETA